MGGGWIAIGNNSKKEETKADFFCGFTNWPSATRAELGAIGTALLAAPENAKVTVATNSAAAIQAIKKSSDVNKLRECFKIKNRNMLLSIQKIKSVKNLDLQLKKVKGHSNILENDIADSLAKKGAREGSILEFKDP